MRVKIIGDITAFDQDIQDSIVKLEKHSSQYDELHFQIALNYGARDEMVRGVRKMLEDCKVGKLNPEDMDEKCFSGYLDTAGIPDPDLMIRTSGEQRLSNFLLWQCAYAEFYFTPTLFPDFTKACFDEALAEYARRDRRMGGNTKK